MASSLSQFTVTPALLRVSILSPYEIIFTIEGNEGEHTIPVAHQAASLAQEVLLHASIEVAHFEHPLARQLVTSPKKIAI